MNPSEPRYEYDAFISYRHVQRDMQIAENLHKALEAYRTPRYLVKKGAAPRLKRIFRDREELPSSSDLSQDIENALLASRFLVVVCSPEAIQSQWVLREVDFFGQHHGYDKILTLLVEGEPADAFPPSLIRNQYDDHGAVSRVIEPLAADIRPANGSTPLKLLKNEKLRILASILGCKYDDLRQREHERRVRRITTLSASAAAFLLAITAFTLWQLDAVSAAREVAVQNEQQALDAKAKAQQSEQDALEAKDKAQQSAQDTLAAQSDLYAMLAKSAADKGDRMLGMSLAMAALPADMAKPERPITQDAQDALYYSAAQYGAQILTYLYPPAATAKETAISCFFADDGSVVTVGNRVVRQFSAATGKMIREWLAVDGYQILAVSPQANRVIIAQYTSDTGLGVQLWDILQDRLVAQYTFDLGDDFQSILFDLHINGMQKIARSGFTSDGKTYYIACNEYYKTDVNANKPKRNRSSVSFYGSDSGRALDLPKLTFNTEIGDILLSGNRLVAALIWGDWNDDHKNIVVYDILEGTLQCQASSDEFPDLSALDEEQQQRLGVTSNGKRFAFIDESNSLHIVSVDTGEAQVIPTDGCRISSNGNLVAYFTKGEKDKEQFVVMDLIKSTSLVVLEPTYSQDIPHVQDFVFCRNDRYILFSDYQMLNISKAETFTLPNIKSPMIFADSDMDGRYLVSLDQGGVATAYQLKDPNVRETVIPAKTDEVAIRDGGVLLFEKLPQVGTIVRRWDAAQNSYVVVSQEKGTVMRLSDVAGGDVGFLTEDGDTFELLDKDTGRAATFALKSAGDIQMDAAGKYVLANNGNVYLYDAQTGNQLRTLQTSQGDGYPAPDMHSVGFFPGGKYCWSAVDNINLEDGYTGIVINDVETGQVVNRISMASVGGSSYLSARTSSDGTRMLIQAVNNLQLWSIDGQMNPEHLCDINGDLLCMDDTTIITNDSNINGDNAFHVYDIKTGQLRASIQTPEAPYFMGRIVDGGKYLLTVNVYYPGPNNLQLWDCSTGKAVATLYCDYTVGDDIIDFGMVNGGTEVAIVAQNNGQTYIRTIPFWGSFGQMYAAAKEKLAGRVYDQAQDLDHIQ